MAGPVPVLESGGRGTVTYELRKCEEPRPVRERCAQAFTIALVFLAASPLLLIVGLFSLLCALVVPIGIAAGYIEMIDGKVVLGDPPEQETEEEQEQATEACPVCHNAPNSLFCERCDQQEGIER